MLLAIPPYLFPKGRPRGKGVQFQLVRLQVQQGQVQDLDLDQHLDNISWILYMGENCILTCL